MKLSNSLFAESSSEGKINVPDLGSLLLRNWSWVFTLTVLGIATGGFLAIKHKPQDKLCLRISLSSGPRIATLQSFDKDSILGNQQAFRNAQPLMLPVQTSPGEAIAMLENYFYDTPLAKDITIKRFEVNNTLSDDQVAACQSIYSKSQDNANVKILRDIGNKYKNYILMDYKDVPGLQPPRQSWIETIRLKSRSNNNSFVAIGGVCGFLAGYIVALIADRKLDRVFSQEHIITLFNYPLLCKLPSSPWRLGWHDVQIKQLVRNMDSSLTWMILSIALDHPMIIPIVQCFSEIMPELDIRHMPPLLLEAIEPLDSMRPIGILIVLEPGFNSELALKDSRNIIAGLPYVAQVGCILIGAQFPSELMLQHALSPVSSGQSTLM